MCLQFNHVFAGKRVGSGEQQCDACIQRGSGAGMKGREMGVARL
jgi:hypothetical protein